MAGEDAEEEGVAEGVEDDVAEVFATQIRAVGDDHLEDGQVQDGHPGDDHPEGDQARDGQVQDEQAIGQDEQAIGQDEQTGDTATGKVPGGTTTDIARLTICSS